MVVLITEARAESLVHWVQPAETNQVPFPLQQLGKPKFPKSSEKKALKHLTFNSKSSSQVLILPPWLFHWQWYSWTHCRPLFYRKRKKHDFSVWNTHRYVSLLMSAPLLWVFSKIFNIDAVCNTTTTNQPFSSKKFLTCGSWRSCLSGGCS